MYKIPILLGTTRKDNFSRLVANFLQTELSKYQEVSWELMDLGNTDFPLLEYRVSAENNITDQLEEWTNKIKSSDGMIVVSPEYKAGYPGSLKNFFDYLPPGVLRYKSVGLSTVSSGVYAGTSCLQQLRQVIIAMAGIVVPDRFQVGNVQEFFDFEGQPANEIQQKIARKFISEMIKYTKVCKGFSEE